MQSKVGSLDNAKHRPGGGARKVCQHVLPSSLVICNIQLFRRLHLFNLLDLGQILDTGSVFAACALITKIWAHLVWGMLFFTSFAYHKDNSISLKT